ncbi:MAG: hypothetical protein WKF97_16465 [Chitinophagaceae bacterium]
MDTQNIDDIIPEQQTGGKTDIDYSETCKTVLDAVNLFVLAKDRLQDVNNWHNLCGPASAVFKLIDSNGVSVQRNAQRGDHFRINIPAPGTTAGDGYDWVKIEEIEDKSNPEGEEEAFAIQVRPTAEPGKEAQNVAHFFKDFATSSFAVQRKGLTVTASVHGRNEVPNTDADGILDKARNTLVAIGALIGFSNPQWKSLVKGLLEKSS